MNIQVHQLYLQKVGFFIDILGNDNLLIKIKFHKPNDSDTQQINDSFRHKIIEQIRNERRFIAKKTAKQALNKLNLGTNSIETQNTLRPQCKEYILILYSRT